MGRHKMRRLYCSTCDAVRNVVIGPRGQSGVCDCGTLIEVPALEPRSSSRFPSRREVTTAVISSVVGGVVSGLVSRPDLLRSSKPQVEHIEIAVASKISMLDEVTHAVGIASGETLGTPRLVQADFNLGVEIL
jgi:hypothetical protein